MIVFQKLRYKNFLSTGNSFTEINFKLNKSTLVVGDNGSGKSTMLDALAFALFGKPHRGINKYQLINSINQKDCLVEVEFKIDRCFLTTIMSNYNAGLRTFKVYSNYFRLCFRKPK